MSKIKSISLVVVLAYLVSAIARSFRILPIENIDVEPEETVNEHEEAKYTDETGIQGVELHTIQFGDLSLLCPVCGAKHDHISVATTTLENREDEHSELAFNDLLTIGVVYYECGHVVHSPCLVNKINPIIIAEEQDNLSFDLFTDLFTCEEHDGSS